MKEDSNLRYPLGYAGFQDRNLKPLRHSSNFGLKFVINLAEVGFEPTAFRL